MTTHFPFIIFSRIDHRRGIPPRYNYDACQCQQCNPTMFDIAMGEPEFAAELFDASKGGNVPGITENDRNALMRVVEQAREPTLIVGESIHINEDYGTETTVRRVYADTMQELRRFVRDNNPGHIEIYSDYDCTGLVCCQTAKFLKIWRTGRGFTAIVEFVVTRDV